MATDSDRFYDRVAFVYPLIDVFLGPQKRKLFRWIGEQPEGRVLEIGVGNGRHFKYYGPHEVIGIDTSKQMLARAKRHRTENIILIQMNGEALSFPGERFDYVVLSHVITVVENPERLVREAHRVLKPGGKLFILNHFTPDNFMQRIDRFFEWLSRSLHFRSVFHLESVRNLDLFKKVSETTTGLLSYFKIVVYEKTR